MANAIRNIHVTELYEPSIRFQPLPDGVINFYITLDSGNDEVKIPITNLPVKIYDNDKEKILFEGRTNDYGTITTINRYESHTIRIEIEKVGFIKEITQIYYI